MDTYNILGICSTGHGASLALISSEYGVRALNLDRFTQKKHSLLFTEQELKSILGKKSPVDTMIYNTLLLSYGKLPPLFVFEKTFLPFLKALLHGLPLEPDDITLVVTSNCYFAVNKYCAGPKLSHYFRNARIHMNLEHHQIHQCQAFFGSPFEDAATLSIDSSGEPLPRLGGKKISMTLAEVHNKQFQIFHEHLYPESSPGALYGAFSEYLGFREGEEGKTMGLAPYGTDRLYKELVGNLSLHDDGSFRFLSGNEIHSRLQQIAKSRSGKKDPITSAHADIAYAADALLADVLVNTVDVLSKKSSSPNLCIAGGVALNSVANEKVFRRSRFKNLYVFPNSGDTGQALGCALYGKRALLDQMGPSLQNDYLGPEYSSAEIQREVIKAGLEPTPVDDVITTTAKLLTERRIIGWFQGGSEYGPRSLGNRSILADPRSPHMKDWLNKRVKHREPFRPFAPAVLENRVTEWFNVTDPCPYMLRVVPVRPERRAQIPAITHVDGSARVQTVDPKNNPRFYRLIEAFESLTGVPVVLNTSFNMAGYPIVETPRDAIQCFLATKIDALILGDILLLKSELKPLVRKKQPLEDIIVSAFGS